MQPGDRAVVSPEGDRTDPSARDTLPDALLDEVAEVATSCARSGKTAIREVETDGGQVRLFVGGLEPPAELLVFGGQPDTAPVVRLARDVGFEVTVATARGGLAEPERFPGAEEVVAVNPTDLPGLVDERTHVVLMSHNLIDDELALEALADTEAPYVGLMGPRKRFEEIRSDLEEDGVDLPESFLDRVATPVGLDLGGGAPMEIALSVVSEVLAVENDREGGRLRDREGPIHGERTHVTGE